MTVDEELHEFEENLCNVFDHHLILNVNWNYWHETDEPHREFFDDIDNALVHIFEYMIVKYINTPVAEILQTWREIIRISVRVAMNVPFPRYPELHAARVTDNLMEVYNQTIYARLRTGMIMVHHSAAVIQRVWKDAVTRPTHPICRRRLLHEFHDLEYLDV